MGLACMSNFSKGVVCSVLLAAAGLATHANAVVINATYGDNDSFNGDIDYSQSYTGMSFPTAAAGDDAYIDGINQGNFSWSPIDLSGYSTINSIVVGYGVYGASAGSVLQLNGTTIADLTSQYLDPDLGNIQNAQQDQVSITDRGILDALLGELITLDFLLGNDADAWSLDYVTFTIDVEEFITPPIPSTPVSEPFTLSLFGLGLAALGFSRKRNKA